MLCVFQYGSTGPKVFMYLGRQIIASQQHRSSTSTSTRTRSLPLRSENKSGGGGVTNVQKEHREFRSLFGCSPEIVAEIWYRIAPRGGEISLKKGAEPRHLLWALLFMKVYANEDALCSMVGGVDNKTFYFWTRYFIRIIATRLYNREVRASRRQLIFCDITVFLTHDLHLHTKICWENRKKKEKWKSLQGICGWN